MPGNLLKDGFLSHLTELRSCLLRAVCSVLGIFIVLVPFAKDLYSILAAPLLEKLPQGGDLIAIGVLSPFIVPMIICFFTAFLIALPYVLYEVGVLSRRGFTRMKKTGAAVDCF